MEVLLLKLSVNELLLFAIKTLQCEGGNLSTLSTPGCGLHNQTPASPPPLSLSLSLAPQLLLCFFSVSNPLTPDYSSSSSSQPRSHLGGLHSSASACFPSPEVVVVVMRVISTCHQSSQRR